MKPLVVIPARLESNRLKQKLLLKIHDKEILLWTAKRVEQAGYDFIVAIDDEIFIDILEQAGCRWVMTSKKHQSGTERLAEVSKIIPHYERYCIVQGDEPLINPVDIKYFIEQGLLSDASYVQAITKFSSEEDPADPSNVKAVISKSGKLLFATRTQIPYCFHSESGSRTDDQLFQISGLYLFKKTILSEFENFEKSHLASTENVEQLVSLYNEIDIQTVEISDPMMSVDTIEDYKRIAANWEQYSVQLKLQNNP